MPPDINAVIHKYGGDGFVVLVLRPVLFWPVLVIVLVFMSFRLRARAPLPGCVTIE